MDIDKDTFNLDPSKIKEAITPETTAILATHVFGNPCDIDAIQQIADDHNLKVICDAAHCFGTTYKGKSVFGYGDVSATSFHATKLFHTIEGGAVFAKDSDVFAKLSYMRNFGHNGPEKFHGIGINGKNSEFHAAMGLCNLEYIDDILANRKLQSECYDTFFENTDLQFVSLEKNSDWNYAYYPVVFKNEDTLLAVKLELEKNNIFPRRYFYPSLSSLSFVNRSTYQISDSISSSILCLPIYQKLRKVHQELICKTILTTLKDSNG